MITKEQQDTIDQLRMRGFRELEHHAGMTTMCRAGIRSALYAYIGPSGKVNGDPLKKFLRRLKFWIRKHAA